MAWQAVVTNGGAALFARWAAGGTLVIRRAGAGTGTTDAAGLMAAQALVNEMQEVSIAGKKMVDGGALYQLNIPAAETAYTVQQIGIWARMDGDSEDILIAIYQNEEGIPVEAASVMPNYVYSFDAIVEMDNTGELQVNIDATALVTQRQLAEALANVDIEVDAAVTATGENPVSGKAVHDYVGATAVRFDAAQTLTPEQQAQARSNIASASTALYTATIPTTGWSSAAPYKVTIALPGILTTDTPLVDIVQTGSESVDAPRREAWAAITRITTADGSITVYAAEEKPAVALPIQMRVVR